MAIGLNGNCEVRLTYTDVKLLQEETKGLEALAKKHGRLESPRFGVENSVYTVYPNRTVAHKFYQDALHELHFHDGELIGGKY